LDLIEALRKRRACRQFEDVKVSREEMENLIYAARRAPTVRTTFKLNRLYAR
jgi:nitroreductase